MSFKRNIFEKMKEESGRWAALGILSAILGIILIFLTGTYFPHVLLKVAGLCLILFTFCFGMTIGLMRAETLLKDQYKHKVRVIT